MAQVHYHITDSYEVEILVGELKVSYVNSLGPANLHAIVNGEVVAKGETLTELLDTLQDTVNGDVRCVTCGVLSTGLTDDAGVCSDCNKDYQTRNA